MNAIAPPAISTARWRAISAAAVGLGIVFLLVQYLWRQSYWGDEIALLNNIGRKTFAQLFIGGLAHSQAAPPIFLAAQKWMWLGFGSGEYSQRLIPVLMAGGALAAFAGLAWKILPPPSATFALAVLCLSDKFNWHATEVKQYSGDVLCAILLMWMALATKTTWQFLWLSLCAAATVWLSHTVVFIYGAISLGLLMQRIPRRRGWIAFTGGNLVFLISFAALYWFSIRHQSNDAYLQDFWRDSFVDWSRPAMIPIWLIKQLWSVCDYIMAPISMAGAILCLLMILGGVSWSKQRQWLLMGICLGPLALVILAAAVEEYPLSGARVDLFLVPGLLIAAGQGMESLTKILASRRIWLSLIIAAMLLPLIVLDVRALFLPRVRMNLRPVIAALRLDRQPDEPIFTPQPEIFRWYWPDAPGQISDSLPLTVSAGQRFWYVVTGRPENLAAEEQPILRQITQTAAEVTEDRILVRGGAAYCFVER